MKRQFTNKEKKFLNQEFKLYCLPLKSQDGACCRCPAPAGPWAPGAGAAVHTAVSRVASPAPTFVSRLNQRPLAQDLNAVPGDFRGNDESLEEGGHFGP